jgi:hypothetical protein
MEFLTICMLLSEPIVVHTLFFVRYFRGRLWHVVRLPFSSPKILIFDVPLTYNFVKCPSALHSLFLESLRE